MKEIQLKAVNNYSHLSWLSQLMQISSKSSQTTADSEFELPYCNLQAELPSIFQFTKGSTYA